MLVAFNAPSLAKFGPTVVPGGTVIYDSSVVAEPPALAPGGAGAGRALHADRPGPGRVMVKNIVALGALQAATASSPRRACSAAIRQALRDKCALIPLNEAAFAGAPAR